MGRIKDKVTREQDADLDAARKAASSAPGAVPKVGGDEMNWNTQAMDAMIDPKPEAPEAPESGEHTVADALEKDFERGVTPENTKDLPEPPVGAFRALIVAEEAALAEEAEQADPDPPSEDEPACSEPVAEPPARAEGDFWNEGAEPAPAEEPAPVSIVKGADADKAYPDLSNLTVRKVAHNNLILEGVCSHCGHCGHKLTDAESVQRGIGPVCSKKGYHEDFVEGDEIQALIDLSEFPELVDFLTEHYKPLGIRGLINGLVRVASLNRPRGRGWSEGNAKVHSACCDAIQALGHLKMADLLRETLIIIEVTEIDDKTLGVWVKKRDWTKYFSYGIRGIKGARFSRQHKKNLVPVTGSDGKPVLTGRMRTTPDGTEVRESNKAALWALLKREYTGAVARVKGKIVKVK